MGQEMERQDTARLSLCLLYLASVRPPSLSSGNIVEGPPRRKLSSAASSSSAVAAAGGGVAEVLTVLLLPSLYGGTFFVSSAKDNAILLGGAPAATSDVNRAKHLPRASERASSPAALCSVSSAPAKVEVQRRSG
jgi:hypothetical protein